MGNQHSSGSRSGHSMTNLPPLLFSTVHGENVSITENRTVARRVSSFCKAIVFSDRPVRVNEKVCIKFIEVSTNWSGVLRFGFTSNDPTTMRRMELDETTGVSQYKTCLPRYACPDLTTKSGFWAKGMCFICASNFWKTKEKGWCPICRAEITDVIRTYKS